MSKATEPQPAATTARDRTTGEVDVQAHRGSARIAEMSDHEMLARLVERGVLTSETRTLGDGWAGQSVSPDGTVTHDGRPSTVQARLVTRWSATSGVSR